MRRLVGLGLVALLALAAPAAASERTGRLVVLTERDAGPAAATAPGVRADGPVAPEIGLVTVRPAPGRTLAETAAALAGRPGVARVVPERRVEPRAAPDDPALRQLETLPGTLPGTRRQWWPLRAGFPAAWDRTRGSGALVGVLDTGIDAGHPELRGRIAGLVDRAEEAWPGPPGVDENGHGTHVSSIACAGTDDGVGIAGAGWRCRLLVIKSDFTEASVAAGIVDAADRGVHALNLSIGADEAGAPLAIRRAVDYAVRRGVVVVAAAAEVVERGRRPPTEQGWPANVLQPRGTGPDRRANRGLSVTAANFDDRRAVFAGRGSQVSLAAYGDYRSTAALGGARGPAGLLGAFPRGRVELERGRNACRCRVGSSPYAHLAGTSMAAPQVAAAAALVRVLNPDLGPADVVALLKRTARRRAGSGWTPDLGWGILDAGAALREAARLDRRAPAVAVAPARRVARSRALVLGWTGADRAPRGVRRAGLRSVTFWARAGRGAARPLGTVARGGRLRFTPRAGVSYSVFALGIDRAGNRQRRSPVTLSVRG